MGKCENARRNKESNGNRQNRKIKRSWSCTCDSWRRRRNHWNRELRERTEGERKRAEEEEEDAIPICGFRRGGRRRRWKKKNLSCGFLLAQRKKRGRGRSEVRVFLSDLLCETRAYSIPSISWWNQITTIYPLFYSFGNWITIQKTNQTHCVIVIQLQIHHITSKYNQTNTP